MNKILCAVFGHKYFFVKNLSFGCKLIKCKRCKKIFGVNHRVKILLEWDEEIEELHKEDL